MDKDGWAHDRTRPAVRRNTQCYTHSDGSQNSYLKARGRSGNTQTSPQGRGPAVTGGWLPQHPLDCAAQEPCRLGGEKTRHCGHAPSRPWSYFAANRPGSSRGPWTWGEWPSPWPPGRGPDEPLSLQKLVSAENCGGDSDVATDTPALTAPTPCSVLGEQAESPLGAFLPRRPAARGQQAVHGPGARATRRRCRHRPEGHLPTTPTGSNGPPVPGGRSSGAGVKGARGLGAKTTGLPSVLGGEAGTGAEVLAAPGRAVTCPAWGVGTGSLGSARNTLCKPEGLRRHICREWRALTVQLDHGPCRYHDREAHSAGIPTDTKRITGQVSRQPQAWPWLRPSLKLAAVFLLGGCSRGAHCGPGLRTPSRLSDTAAGDIALTAPPAVSAARAGPRLCSEVPAEGEPDRPLQTSRADGWHLGRVGTASEACVAGRGPPRGRHHAHLPQAARARGWLCLGCFPLIRRGCSPSFRGHCPQEAPSSMASPPPLRHMKGLSSQTQLSGRSLTPSPVDLSPGEPCARKRCGYQQSLCFCRECHAALLFFVKNKGLPKETSPTQQSHGAACTQKTPSPGG
ncbi:uncharacterized protein WM277_001482 [Molossus nigricans]